MKQDLITHASGLTVACCVVASGVAVSSIAVQAITAGVTLTGISVISPHPLVPAQAGTCVLPERKDMCEIPAFAGMSGCCAAVRRGGVSVVMRRGDLRQQKLDCLIHCFRGPICADRPHSQDDFGRKPDYIAGH